jgi:lysozyme
MTALKIACDLAKEFEGFRSKPYLCPAGIATIGYGSTHHKDGSPVTLKDKEITEQDAEKLLEDVMANCLEQSMSMCKNLTNHSEGRQAAIADFIYNLGAHRFESSTLRKMILEEKWDKVPDQLRRWVYAGTIILEGLKKRREAEISLL